MVEKHEFDYSDCHIVHIVLRSSAVTEVFALQRGWLIFVLKSVTIIKINITFEVETF